MTMNQTGPVAGIPTLDDLTVATQGGDVKPGQVVWIIAEQQYRLVLLTPTFPDGSPDPNGVPIAPATIYTPDEWDIERPTVPNLTTGVIKQPDGDLVPTLVDDCGEHVVAQSSIAGDGRLWLQRRLVNPNYTTETGVGVQSVQIPQGVAYALRDNTALRAFGTDGALIWTCDPSGTNTAHIHSCTADSQGNSFLGVQEINTAPTPNVGKLVCVDAEGVVKWTRAEYRTPPNFVSLTIPRVAHNDVSGRVWAYASQGWGGSSGPASIAEFDAETGAILATYETDNLGAGLSYSGTLLPSLFGTSGDKLAILNASLLYAVSAANPTGAPLWTIDRTNIPSRPLTLTRPDGGLLVYDTGIGTAGGGGTQDFMWISENGQIEDSLRIPYAQGGMGGNNLGPVSVTYSRDGSKIIIGLTSTTASGSSPSYCTMVLIDEATRTIDSPITARFKSPTNSIRYLDFVNELPNRQYLCGTRDSMHILEDIR